MTDSESDDGGDPDVASAAEADREAIDRVERDGIVARYCETDEERVLAFEGRAGATAAIAQNREGYAMLKVRPAPDGDELERYYGFDIALDHAGELLGAPPARLPVPDAAADMGM